MNPVVHIVLGNHITNIGNAFLDLGSEASIRAAVPGVTIRKSSSFPAWYSHTQLGRGLIRRRSNPDFFSVSARIDSNFAIFSGMVITDGFVQRYGRIIRTLRDRGVKIVLNGAGPGHYTKEEETACRSFWSDVGLHALISRDRFTFETYGDIADNSFDGIDCGFFLNDIVDEVVLKTEPYTIFAFDQIEEPTDIETDLMIVRPHHKLFPELGLPNQNVMRKKNVFISEFPIDYLNIYANADTVYSDRVHACVAAVSFGKPFRLITTSKRALLFEKLGVSTDEIGKGPVNIDSQVLEKAKRKQVAFLAEVFSDAD